MAHRATDPLGSSFLGCRHRTALEIGAATGRFARPQFADPHLEALFRRGLDHETDDVRSLAASGVSFLFSLNRLNVATSRAKCAAILVASPWLFEPDCRTPRQMKLANALCRYQELARSASINI